MTRPQLDAPDAADRSTETAVRAGTIAGLVGAVPLVGPALVAGCLSCVGFGTGVGLGATGALPPRWWLAGLAVTAVAVTAVEVVRARACHRRARPGMTLASLIGLAIGAWVVTRYGIVPLVDWLTGPKPEPVDGPILP